MPRRGPAPAPAAAHVPAARRRVLDEMRGGGTSDAHDVAARLGLHVSTARFHLDALVAGGHVVRVREHEGRVGRPRQLYRAVDPPEDQFRALATVLLDELASDERGADLARRAGRRWLAAPAAPDDDPTARLVAELDRLGFEPRAAVEADGIRVEMRACPYLDEARLHPSVVCGVHQGMVDALVGDGGAAVELVPFATDDYCLLRVRR